MTNFIENHLDILQNIESGLKTEYEINKELNDVKLIFALENGITAIKKEFGFARNEKLIDDKDIKGVIELAVRIGKERINETKDITLKDYTKCIEQIIKSVKRHSQDGRRGYYDFIKGYV